MSRITLSTGNKRSIICTCDYFSNTSPSLYLNSNDLSIRLNSIAINSGFPIPIHMHRYPVLEKLLYGRVVPGPGAVQPPVTGLSCILCLDAQLTQHW